MAIFYDVMPDLRTPLILLAEDCLDDEFFFRSALGRSRFSAELVHVADGAAAVRMLAEARDPDGRRRTTCPDILFLDLKMPEVGGFEVLMWLREHPFSPPLDVAVLSGSDRELDIARAKSLGASAFYVKPLSVEHLRAHLQDWSARRPLSPSS